MSIDNSAELRLGRLFESEFHRKAYIRGLTVIPHYQQLGMNGIKAPMAAGPLRGYRLPDFEILGKGWVEAKYKGRSPFYGVGGCFVHGIDLPNWRDYLSLCALDGRPGFMVVGEGATGEILIASFKKLERVQQIQQHAGPAFAQGAVFWPRDSFRLWGRFDRQNGQMQFHFDFRDDVDWLPSRHAG